MQRFLRYLLLSLLWGGVVAYVGYAALLARAEHREAVVQRLDIVVADSSVYGSLVQSDEVLRWMKRQGRKLVGQPCDSIDLAAIEHLILKNGFVATAEASLQGEGLLSVRLTQRQPLLRLRLEGMDSYLTREGYLFAVPPRSARYVPVVTGSYRPPVPLRYTGCVRDYIDHELWKIDTMILALERSKLPHYAAERQNDRNLRGVSRKRTSKHWWRLEREERFQDRVKVLRAEKAALRKMYRYRGRQIQAEIDRIEMQQEQLRAEQKKLKKKYEDFMKLLTFVEQVEQNDFWGSELVEIIASTTSSGALELALVPRSGHFTIQFGRIEQVEEKFEKLDRFYRDGLRVVGWDCFREVDVRFSNQVVCR